MNCDRKELEAWIDGEPAPADAAALEEHLRTCGPCSAEALARMQLKRDVRSAARAFRPSPEFRARIAGQIAPRRRPTRFFRSPALISALAAFLIVVFSLEMIAGRWAREHAVTELLDLHVATLASANPVDVVSSDRHTVKPWFQGKLPFTFNLPELGGSQYALLGGKLVYFDHDPGAELLFSLRQHRLSVFVTRNAGPLLDGTLTVRGFSVESWSADGLRWAIISDAAPADLHALADLLRNAQTQ